MKNVVIPIDLSSSSQNIVGYALRLMKGKECNFWIFDLSAGNNPDCTSKQEFAIKDCRHHHSLQNLQKLQKKVKKFFPYEKFSIKFLPSLDQVENISLLLANHKIFLREGISFNIISKGDWPLLFIPEHQEFKVPQNLLISLHPLVEIRQATLTHMKKIFGHHKYFIEFQKVYRSTVNSALEARDEFELKQLFEIYQPKFRKVHAEDFATVLGKMLEQERADLHVLPVSHVDLNQNILLKPVREGIINSKIPIMILPEKEKPFSRSRSHRYNSKTAISS